MAQFVFNNFDYCVFLFMLAISTSIGIYFGFFTKSAKTTEEYLLGGRKMKTIPIAISLVASQLSAFTIMTLPGEMYVYGVNYIFMIFVMFINVPIICWIILPVFYNNNISNCYEYLEQRFNRATRELLTFGFMFTLLMIMPIFNFMPSLAFAQVTNFNIHVINTIVCSICVFYTMFGGLKAVVWTDVVQASIMLFFIIFVCIMGIKRVDGIGNVLQITYAGNRLKPDFTLDLKTRTTFWNATLSSVFVWVSYVGLNQSCVQRITSLPTVNQAKRSILLFGVGYFIIVGTLCITGLIMYALYHDCDPILAGFVDKPDKLLPYFVQDIVGHIQGMPGLFISCVFSASLSTLSAAMNALTGIIYMDYIRPRIKHSERKASIIMKTIVLLLGLYCIFGGMIVEKFNSALQLMYALTGVTFGAIFAVYTMGMLMPKVHGRAAFCAVVASMLIMLIIAIGALNNKPYTYLPTSIENCSTTDYLTKNISISNDLTNDKESFVRFSIFEMSFNWYTVFGALFVYVIGLVLSYILPAPKNKTIQRNLLSPVIQPYFKYELTKTTELPVMT